MWINYLQMNYYTWKELVTMSQKFLAVTQSLHQVCEFSQDDLWPGALHSLTTPPLVTETEEEEERKKERWRTVERKETPQFSCSRQNGALFLRKLRHVSTKMKVTGGFADCFQKNFLLFSFFSFFFFIKRHRVLLASRPLPSLFKKTFSTREKIVAGNRPNPLFWNPPSERCWGLPLR